MKRAARVFRLLFFCLSLHAGHILAQDYIYAVGDPTFAVNIPVENGFINITNGNLHMEFPLATHRQRGVLNLNERLVYDSRIWRILPTTPNYGFYPSNVPTSPDTEAGWRFVAGNEPGSVNTSYTLTPVVVCPRSAGSHQLGSEYFTWVDSDGTSHDFGMVWGYQPLRCTNLDPPPATQTSSGWAIDGSGYEVLLSGQDNREASSIRVIDSNGTQVYPQVIDRYGNYWSSDANGNLIDDVGRTPVVKTISGNVTYYDVLAPNGPIDNNGKRVRYTVTTTPITIRTLFQQSDVSDWAGTANLIQSIQLPDGSLYSFTYDGYAEMTSVTLPTGGTIHYGWTNYQDSYKNTNRWLTSRQVGANPAATFTPSVITQCASNETGCKEKVVVYKPSGDETVYELTLVKGAWNTKVEAYTGAVGPTPTLTTETTYCYNDPKCDPYVLPSASFTTLSNGLKAQQQFVYDMPWLGKPTKVQEWDYFTGSPAQPPTKETDYLYSGLDLHQITVLNNGVQVAQTTYDYTTSATTTSGIPQHGAANAGGPYLQKVTQWLNGGTSPYTTYGMDDTGMVSSITDPKQNPASAISYQCSNALPYQTKNSLGQTTTYSYDCNSGAILGVKDPNDAVANRAGTTYQYESGASRIQAINYPDGGRTFYSYPSPVEVDTSVLATPNPTITSQDIEDTFGRISQHVQASTSTETTYDSNGRVSCTSNSHYSNLSSTDGITCITGYDGLDRPKIQTQPDGSTLTWSYAGNTVTSTDEAGNSWQRTSDAFGRLTKVIEPNSANTDYSYGGLTTTVSQKGVGIETSRPSRTFISDSLGRLVSVSEPERGTTTYGYDNNGNLKTKTDARGVTISYDYDSLNRLTHKTGTGINDNYYYDTDPDPRANPGNGIGRLVWSTNNINVDRHRAYDAMGRLVHVQGTSPGNPGYAANAVSAEHDLAGNIISLTYPDGRTITQGFNDAGRMSSVSYASWNGNGKSYAYLSSASYDPMGNLIGGTMGNGVGIASKYDGRQHIKMLGYGTTSQLLWGKGYQWYSNGNLQSITDAFSGIQRQFGYDNLNRLTTAQDILDSTQGANTTPFQTGAGVTYPGVPGSTMPPIWTNPDDSNLLPEIGEPGANWDYGHSTVTTNAAVAPDGTMTATSISAGSYNNYIAGYATSPSSYSGETITASVWLRSTTGNQTLYLFKIDQGPNGRQYAGSTQITVTDQWQQFQVTGSVQNNLTGLLIEIGGNGDFNTGQTLLMWHPMIEDEGAVGTTTTNFLRSSQRLIGGYWNGPIGGLLDNTNVAPDGTNTAGTIIGGNSGYIVNSIPDPAPYSNAAVTASVWLRSPSGSQQIVLTLVENGSSGFTNALGSQTANVTTTWQRFQITGTTQSSLTELQFEIGPGFSAGQNVYFWGAQMELASTAGPYVATGTVPVTAGSRLTNLFSYSQQPNAPSWSATAGGSGTANAVSAPDGSHSGYEFTAVGGNGYMVNDVAHPALYDNATLTASLFLRSPTGSGSVNVILYGWNDSGWALVQSVNAQLASTWKRFSITGQAPNGLTRLYLQIGDVYQTGQVIDVWGSQLELSATAGPYVPTSVMPVLTSKESANILLSSQRLNGPTWDVVNASTTINSAVAPDGTTTAATIGATADSYAINNVPNPSLYDQQTVTGSVYLKVPSGTLNTVLVLINVGESGWGVAGQVPVTITTDWQRFSVTGTNQNGLVQLGLQIGGGSSISTGQSLQIWGAQLVTGTSPAPYTPTPSPGGTIDLVTGQPATLVPNGLLQAYQYDSFGNILQNGSFNDNYTAMNQMIGYAYDASGNLLSDGLYNTFTWDAENRMLTGGGATYVYDTEGNRISVSGVGVTDTVYFAGVPIARYSAGGWTDLIYGPQGVIAEVAGAENADPQYRLADHLGSSIGQVGSNGIMTNPMDYSPFGQRMTGSTGDSYQYTGLEHDQETNLDHATFRQYSSTQGRWMAPDPYLGSMDFGNPQSFNRYSYVGNSPLSFTDREGLAPEGGSPVSVGKGCVGAVITGGINPLADAACVGSFLNNWFRGLFGALSGPSFNGSLTPRPSGAIWDEHGGFSAKPYSSIAGIIGDVGGLSSSGCEFGACGGLPDGFQAQAAAPVIAAPICAIAEPCGAIVLGTAIAITGIEAGVAGYKIYQRGRTNVSDTGIVSEAQQLIAQGLAKTMCDALAILQAGTRDAKRLQRIKATQKAYGCRRSSAQS